MAGKSASASISFQYVDVGGKSVTVSKTVTNPYDNLEAGILDIPSGATAGFSESLDFGSVTKATGLLVINKAGVDIGVRVNGVTADRHVADGSFEMFAYSAAPGSTPISSFTVSATTAQPADGQVEYVVLGPT